MDSPSRTGLAYSRGLLVASRAPPRHLLSFRTLAPRHSIPSQPAPVGVNTAATAGQWGVEVYISVQLNAATGKYTYAVTSDVYGSGGGAALLTTPIPPGTLRRGVQLVYGLIADFDDEATISPTTGRGAKFAWRLPSCSVAQETAADVDYELAECGNRGVCDRMSGVCKCLEGYAGYSCSQQTVVV